jgi:hypothetical protein
MIMNEWPALQEWIHKNPLKILKYANEWNKITSVLRWFSQHPNSGLYMRQIDIPGIDTKYIEHWSRHNEYKCRWWWK